jgi:hypothetical protein
MIDNLSRSGYSVTRLSASLSGSAKWPLLKSWHSLHLGIFSRGGATAAKIYAIRANLSQEHKAFAAEMQIRAERESYNRIYRLRSGDTGGSGQCPTGRTFCVRADAQTPLLKGCRDDEVFFKLSSTPECHALRGHTAFDS